MDDFYQFLFKVEGMVFGLCCMISLFLSSTIHIVLKVFAKYLLEVLSNTCHYNLIQALTMLCTACVVAATAIDLGQLCTR